MERLGDMVTHGRIDPSVMATHIFKSFDKVEDAFILMKEKPRDLIKSVVLLE
jgi:alcohol dehydrogenase (NADP+)